MILDDFYYHQLKLLANDLEMTNLDEQKIDPLLIMKEIDRDKYKVIEPKRFPSNVKITYPEKQKDTLTPKQ